ncbi:MAG: thermonuclease family protein [Proteobacteria bacterium]|nr:thermonuclease family protein [Pseudomonadota bacterium]
MKISLKNYEKLLTKIRQKISETKKNIVQSVDYQKVLMSWEIGKEIDLYLKGESKAEYGKQLFLQLTKDVGIKKTLLYQMRAFYKSYPEIPTQKNSLSWNHYRGLIAVKDDLVRQQLENLVIENSLSGNHLQREIIATKKQKKLVKKSPAEIPQLKIKRGKIGTYSTNKEGEIDLGFNIFLSTKRKVRDTKNEYTYSAELERIVDGDTLHVKLDLGFKIKHHEILRLAKIDAADSVTKEGRMATAFLKKTLNNAKILVVKTNKTDLYGRYVADVFFDPTGQEKDPQKIAKTGTYLNQLLLDQKLVELWRG